MNHNETMHHRFTIDGSLELESRLDMVCQKVLAGVRALTGSRLEALVLGGGYGRGQGGVLRTDAGDQAYNDLEFYGFLRGPRLLNDRRVPCALGGFGGRCSRVAGIPFDIPVALLCHL